jgi:hypothetical protein
MRDNGIDTHRQHGSNAIALFESDTDINKLELEIDTPLKRDNGIDTHKLELEIDTPLKRDNGIDTHRPNDFNAIAIFECSTFSPCDRDISTTPPLGVGLVLDIAGQASAARPRTNPMSHRAEPNSEFQTLRTNGTHSIVQIKRERFDDDYYHFHGLERGMHGFEHIGVYAGTNNEFYHLHDNGCDETIDPPHQLESSDLVMMSRDNYDSSQDKQSIFSPCDRDTRSEPPLEGGPVLGIAGQASADRTIENPDILMTQKSPFSPRDRDIPAAPPLGGGTVMNLAGQASADRTIENPAIQMTQKREPLDTISGSNNERCDAIIRRTAIELDALSFYHLQPLSPDNTHGCALATALKSESSKVLRSELASAHGLPRGHHPVAIPSALRKSKTADANWLHASYYEYPLTLETNNEHLQTSGNLGNDITLVQSDTDQHGSRHLARQTHCREREQAKNRTNDDVFPGKDSTLLSSDLIMMTEDDEDEGNHNKLRRIDLESEGEWNADHEIAQMNDDVLREQNRSTEEIISAFENLSHSSDPTLRHMESTNFHHNQYSESLNDDIYENTDTEDGWGL